MKTLINETVLANFETTTKEVLAKKLNVSVRSIVATFSSLKRRKLIPTNKHLLSSLTIETPKIEIKAKEKFQNVKGEKKQVARDLMVKSIVQSEISKGTILTLPFIHCKIEQQLINIVGKKYNFLGCENDPIVYNQMLMTIAQNNLPISTHKGNIKDKINIANENEYSHLILDYCGQLGTTHEEIKTAIENNIVQVGGVIAITLNKRITPNTEFIYELMEKLNPRTKEDEDTRCEHALRTFINRIGGLNYAIESVLNYHDTTSMILMIVRRIN